MNHPLAERDVRADALRGLMLVIIAIDHIPNPLREFTYQSVGFVSAAEGFVFLSGYVAGLVYTRQALSGTLTALWKRAASRAGQIYLYHIVVFTAILLATTLKVLQATQLESWAPLFYKNAPLALLLGATLTYQPRFQDILPMYCVLILLAPVLVALLVRRRILLVLSASLALWFCAQFGIRAAIARAVFHTLPIDLGDFDVFAWQLLFVGGFCVGFRRCNGTKQEPRFETVSLAVCYALALALFALRQDLLFPNSSAFLWPLAEKTPLGPVRVLNFLMLAFLISREAFWPKQAFWVRSLAYLGRHSLQVFSFNILCVHLVLGVFSDWDSRPALTKLIIAILCAASLCVPASMHEFWLRLRRRDCPESRATS